MLETCCGLWWNSKTVPNNRHTVPNIPILKQNDRDNCACDDVRIMERNTSSVPARTSQHRTQHAVSVQRLRIGPDRQTCLCCYANQVLAANRNELMLPLLPAVKADALSTFGVRPVTAG